MSNSNLVNVTVPAYEGNYTQGRSKNIEKITIHHCAGVFTAEQIGSIFQRVGRQGSSNYGIGNDGRVGLFVEEKDTPWTDGNWDSNCKSVTIETSNSQIGGDWLVSDEALNSLIKLVADISKRNNLGRLVKGKNLTWHQMYSATACPGNYLISKMDYICEKANDILDNDTLDYDDEPTNEYFVAGDVYRLVVAKCLHTSPSLGNNILQANKVDSYTKTLLTSNMGNAMLKVGTEVQPLKIVKENGRIWGSYGNCWFCMQNDDGTKQAVKVDEEYFVAGGTYKLLYDKCLRKTPELANNILQAEKTDTFTKTLLTSSYGNAMIRAGVELICLKLARENGRVWGSYGNCWVCLQNKDGEKQAEKI